MRQNHMVGITPAGIPDYSMLKAAGIRWLRGHGGLPYEDKVGGKIRPRFEEMVRRCEREAGLGFKILASTPTPGSSRYDPQTKTTHWQYSLPAWAGTHDEDRYYETLRASCAEAARRMKGLADWWQIANEPDIETFRGPLSDDQMERFLLESARGIKDGNPAAHCGINLGGPNDYARRLAQKIYGIEACPFDYVGIDGYFGSWQRGGPENWPAFIDEAHALTGRPVIIAEWGYSSLQKGKITDDPERKKHYNQDVCRKKEWGKVWKLEHSPEEQAAYIRACVGIFADHPHCIGNFFFRWGDTATCWQCGQPDCPAECAWGMVDVNGEPKPAFYALKDRNRSLFGTTE
jgi:hypothetical protein